MTTAEHGYETRRESAVPWEDVPERNKALMIAVAAEIERTFADLVGQATEFCPTCGGPVR